MASFMKQISIISRCAIQYRGERLAGLGLNGCHIEYILNICRSPGISQDRLAQVIHVNGSSVTRQLALLEENGFVERRRSLTDRRMVEVYPTQKASDSLPAVREALQDWSEYLTAGFTAEEKACLTRLLERVCEKAERFTEDMPGLAACAGHAGPQAPQEAPVEPGPQEPPDAPVEARSQEPPEAPVGPGVESQRGGQIG